MEIPKVSMEGLYCGTKWRENVLSSDPEVGKEATIQRERRLDWNLGVSAAAGTGEQVACRNEPAVWEKTPEKGWRWAASPEAYLVRLRHSTQWLESFIWV